MKKAEGSDNKLERMLDFFTDETENHAVVVFMVIKRVKNMKSENCSNFKQTPCLDGQRLTIENFVPGAKFRLNGFKGLGILRRIEDDVYFSANYEGEGVSVKFHIQYECECV